MYKGLVRMKRKGWIIGDFLECNLAVNKNLWIPFDSWISEEAREGKKEKEAGIGMGGGAKERNKEKEKW